MASEARALSLQLKLLGVTSAPISIRVPIEGVRAKARRGALLELGTSRLDAIIRRT